LNEKGIDESILRTCKRTIICGESEDVSTILAHIFDDIQRKGLECKGRCESSYVRDGMDFLDEYLKHLFHEGGVIFESYGFEPMSTSQSQVYFTSSSRPTFLCEIGQYGHILRCIEHVP
jgi:hypothetical protein